MDELGEILNRPILDMGAIERLEEWGGSALAGKMLEIFLDSSEERMDQIRKGLAQGDPETAERGAHSLKSSAGNVGAVRLQALAEMAEALAEAKNQEGLEELLPLVEEAFAEGCDALRNLLEGMEE